MVAFSEMILVLLLVASPNSLGLPLGVPPADEVPLLAQVAPDDCLFYASWATVDVLDAGRSPTEQWLAQPKIQAFWSTARQRIFQFALDESSFEFAAEKELTELAAALADQAMVRGTAIFMENADRMEDVRTGCLIHLSAEIVPRVAERLRQLRDTMPEEWTPRTFVVGGNEYVAFRPFGKSMELALGLRGQFAVVGAGPDASRSIERIEASAGGSEPAWLTEMKNHLSVPRRSSMSYVDVHKVVKLAEAEPDHDGPELRMFALDLLRLDAVQSFESVCGIDDRGMVSRQRIRLDPTIERGLPAIIHSKPLSSGCWEVLTQQRDWTVAYRFSVDGLFDLIRQSAEFGAGPMLDEQLEIFHQSFGVRLKEDLLDYLDGSVLVQGNFDSGDPLGSLLIQFGLDDEMSFFDHYETFNERLRELLANQGGGSKLVVDEVGGTKVYSIEHPRDFMFMPEPVWCLRGGHVCLAFDRSAIQKRIESPGPRLVEDAELAALLDEAGQFGLEKPLGITRLDMAAAIRLVMSFSSMFGPMLQDAPIQMSDLPATEVLVNGLQPSLACTFRTEVGLEVYSRQTLPSAAPGATVAGVGLLAAPSAVVIRAQSQQTISKNNMRWLAIALHNHHDAFMAFPARFNQNPDGQPMLSWRVQILPWLDESELFEQFRFDEPWDSEHNRTLIEKMPEVFKHPKMDLPPGHTVYLALAGKDTLWPAPKDDGRQPTGIALEKVRDGTSNTGMLIEVPAESAVIWTKPDDFDVDQAGFAEKLKKVWSKGLIVTTADAAVHTFRDDLSAEQWRALFNYNDGIPLDMESMRAK